MKWSDDLPEDWDAVDDDPPIPEPQEAKLTRLDAGYVVRELEVPAGKASARAIWSDYSANAEPKPAERAGR